MEFTDARKRMARIPKGAELIDNPVSVAPGFKIGNVHVMAGVPSIFQAMMDNVGPTLEGGTPIISRAMDCSHGEGTIGGPLGQIQANHSQTAIGSYPRFDGKNYSTQIIIRSRNEAAIEAAAKDVAQMLAELDAQKVARKWN
jgi:molybdopterin-biosynthesis enzyme MoeA-like protein